MARPRKGETLTDEEEDGTKGGGGVIGMITAAVSDEADTERLTANRRTNTEDRKQRQHTIYNSEEKPT